jgi:hypothetical protein
MPALPQQGRQPFRQIGPFQQIVEKYSVSRVESICTRESKNLVREIFTSQGLDNVKSLG